ncbi:hypothetical protein [Streptomyces lincolnensis]|uniref:hypothetical protein n=1 Tax=Streptomyces lincolnensis TaxID=1915 RepID=UPI0015FCB55E
MSELTSITCTCVLDVSRDGTRLIHLVRDNRLSVPTAYRYRHEGLTALADHSPHP